MGIIWLQSSGRTVLGFLKLLKTLRVCSKCQIRIVDFVCYFISAYFVSFTVFRSAIFDVVLLRNSGQIYIK